MCACRRLRSARLRRRRRTLFSTKKKVENLRGSVRRTTRTLATTSARDNSTTTTTTHWWARQKKSSTSTRLLPRRTRSRSTMARKDSYSKTHARTHPSGTLNTSFVQNPTNRTQISRTTSTKRSSRTCSRHRRRNRRRRRNCPLPFDRLSTSRARTTPSTKCPSPNCLPSIRPLFSTYERGITKTTYPVQCAYHSRRSPTKSRKANSTTCVTHACTSSARRDERPCRRACA
mmetsp:Transcript_2901/g.6454  ORF Transcript_2901/g.6454 Transcript_2901/m.6454 type:complete len:231 (-) Transcript_2901:85-777(-)